MSYYDNIKKDVRTKNRQKENKNEDDGKMTGNFDSLKQAAEETSEQEQEGDDTPIEVIEEGGIKTEESGNQQQKKQAQRSQDTKHSQESKQQGNPLKQNTSSQDSSGSTTDLSNVEEKMDKIIDQNQEMIDILRSFTQ